MKYIGISIVQLCVCVSVCVMRWVYRTISVVLFVVYGKKKLLFWDAHVCAMPNQPYTSCKWTRYGVHIYIRKAARKQSYHMRYRQRVINENLCECKESKWIADWLDWQADRQTDKQTDPPRQTEKRRWGVRVCVNKDEHSTRYITLLCMPYTVCSVSNTRHPKVGAFFFFLSQLFEC